MLKRHPNGIYIHIKKECQFGIMTFKNITYLEHTAINKTYMAREATS